MIFCRDRIKFFAQTKTVVTDNDLSVFGPPLSRIKYQCKFGVCLILFDQDDFNKHFSGHFPCTIVLDQSHSIVPRKCTCTKYYVLKNQSTFKFHQLPKKSSSQVLEFKLQLLIISTIPLQSMNQATNFLNFHLFTTYAAK